jgi:hypothetical protein
MIDNYPVLATRFLHEKDEAGKIIRTRPYFDFDPYCSKVRKPIVFGCVPPKIPLIFNGKTGEVLRMDEVTKEKHD